jgi:hypothetical protein
MKKSRYTEEQIAFALKQADRHAGSGGHPPDRDFGADVLPVEEGVRWSQRR